MKKKIVVLSLVATMAMSMMGCGNSDSESKSYDLDKCITLGEYSGIEVTMDSTEVTEDQINDAIQLAMEDAALTESTEYTADVTVEQGDIAAIDYVGKVDGVEFEGGTGSYNLTIGSNAFIEGFEEGLVGVAVGQTVELDLTFPENYNEDLAGKDVVFTVTVNSVTRTTYPELTDEIASTLSEALYTTVDSYKAYLNETILADNESTAATNKQTNVWNTVVSNATINEYPEELVEKYIADYVDTFTSYAEMYSMDMTEFMSSYYGMDEETYTAQIEEAAKSTVAEKFVCEAIAKAEGIEVTDEEYTTALEGYATAYGVTTEEFEETYGEDVIKAEILREKIVEFVTDAAVEM